MVVSEQNVSTPKEWLKSSKKIKVPSSKYIIVGQIYILPALNRAKPGWSSWLCELHGLLHQQVVEAFLNPKWVLETPKDPKTS